MGYRTIKVSDELYATLNGLRKTEKGEVSFEDVIKYQMKEASLTLETKAFIREHRTEMLTAIKEDKGLPTKLKELLKELVEDL